MAEIKIREVSRGHIKTLDRASSSMHHIKAATVRTKTSDLYGRQDDDADSYAQDSVEHYSGDSAAYAAQAGVELILRSRGENAGATVQSVENIQQISPISAISATESNQNVENIQHAFREQGAKSIQSRLAKVKMADAEVIRNAEESRFADRVISGNRIRGDELIHQNAARIGRKSLVQSKSDEYIHHARKEHAIRRILNSRESRMQNIMTLLKPGNDNKRRTRNISGFLRIMWENAKSAAAYIGAGGASIVIILTLFVFFGIGVITFSNNSPETSVTEDQEEIVYFIPDMAGSPTRIAIVKAAAREVGNVGGEKFWRWYGFKGHVHWCACFTSYIAAECGCIQTGICPKSALVDDWVSFYKKQHRWARGDYIPHSGDFIIFDWEGDGSPDHIGIVESCDGKTVHTIEGNSRDVCKRKTYTRGSGLIYGYGCPNYSGA